MKGTVKNLLTCTIRLQGSRWMFQATRMNGHMGSFTILPDQMQIISPLMVLMLVPLFDAVVYPCLNQCGSATALKRIGCGLFLCGLSFVASGIVELNLEVNSTIVLFISTIRASQLRPSLRPSFIYQRHLVVTIVQLCDIPSEFTFR